MASIDISFITAVLVFFSFDTSLLRRPTEREKGQWLQRRDAMGVKVHDLCQFISISPMVLLRFFFGLRLN